MPFILPPPPGLQAELDQVFAQVDKAIDAAIKVFHGGIATGGDPQHIALDFYLSLQRAGDLDRIALLAAAAIRRLAAPRPDLSDL